MVSGFDKLTSLRLNLNQIESKTTESQLLPLPKEVFSGLLNMKEFSLKLKEDQVGSDLAAQILASVSKMKELV